MKLTLEHLAPYLPYGLKMWDATNNEKWSLEPKNFANRWEFCFKSKPILRPLSDLTKEIEVDGGKFVPLVEIINYLSFKLLRYEISGSSLDIVFDNKMQSKERFWFSNFKGVSFYCSNMNKLIYKDIYGAIQKLFEWHFDVFGLIDKNLAIDINTIKP